MRRKECGIWANVAYSLDMRCVLGFDGGGSKTECVLMDDAGTVLARSRSGPSNPARVGVVAALEALEQAASVALAEAAVGRSDLAAVCAGLAGTGDPKLSEDISVGLSALFLGAAVRVCTDLEAALGAAGEQPSVVLVAGTGSAVIGIDAVGRTARAGGHGPLLGDEGSAYDIGRRAVVASVRNAELTGRESALGKQLLRQLGCSHWLEVQQRAAKNADEVFPRLFPVITAAADVNDETARALLEKAALDLAALAKIVTSRLHLGAMTFLLAKTGGMVGRNIFFDERLDAALRESAPKARIGPLPMSPADGAAHLALRLLSNAEFARD
jgi:N-acetylglucosamine kinase-like BadF-type ATPase